VNSYVAGSLVRVATYTGLITNPVFGFRDASGNLADPTVVTLKYRPAGGAVTTAVYPAAPIVKDAVGLYHADVDTTGSAPTAPVIWSYSWTGTGAVQGIAQNQFEATPPLIP
jgi:hypothetical protein